MGDKIESANRAAKLDYVDNT